MFDEPPGHLYHTIAPDYTLQVDETGSINQRHGQKMQRILLYAITVKSPIEKVPSIAIAEHITSNHNVFYIRNLFNKLPEIKYQIYQPKVLPKLVVTDNSKAMIQAVLNE